MEMGMATEQQMASLGDSQSVGFDRQFLQLMIRHHEGAVDMVEDLLDKPGSAYDPLLFEFVGDELRVFSLHVEDDLLTEDCHTVELPYERHPAIKEKNMKIKESWKCILI